MNIHLRKFRNYYYTNYGNEPIDVECTGNK